MFKIPEFNFGYAERKIKQLQKVCVKLDLPVVEMKIVSESVECINEAKVKANSKVEKRWVKFFIVELLNADTPKLSGWSFAAVINHEEAGNVFLASPKLDKVIPAHYRHVGAVCEHCNLKRDRKDSFILLSDSGEWKQVGRSCLKDFLGHKSPEAIAAFSESLYNFSELQDFNEDDFSEGGGGGGYRSDYYEVEKILQEGAKVVRKDGYISRAMENAEQGRPATSEIVYRLINKMQPAERKLLSEYYGEILDADVKVAAEALEWAKNLPEDSGNDYLWNLRVIANSEVVKSRSVGLAVSILVAFNRACLAKFDKERRVNEWYGAVGEKVDVEAEYVFHAQFDSQYGVCHIHSFLVDGKELVWKSSVPLNELEKGAKVKLAAKIKAHSMYKDKKQSMIERAKVVLLVAA